MKDIEYLNEDEIERYVNERMEEIEKEMGRPFDQPPSPLQLEDWGIKNLVPLMVFIAGLILLVTGVVFAI